jgi:hypothetical protein
VKIGKPTTNIPVFSSSKYREIWDAINSLGPEEWIPVECDSPQEARRLQSICTSQNKARTRVRGNTIYLSKKESK